MQFKGLFVINAWYILYIWFKKIINLNVKSNLNLIRLGTPKLSELKAETQLNSVRTSWVSDECDVMCLGILTPLQTPAGPSRAH